MKKSLPSLINTLLVTCIAAVCTYWFLQWVSVRTPPEPLAPVPAGDRVARTQPLDTEAVAKVFGALPVGTLPEATSSRIRLEGVIAEGGRGKGIALIAVDDQPSLAYRAGEAIDAGLTLAEVHADRVILSSSTGRQEVRLPEDVAPSGIVPAR